MIKYFNSDYREETFDLGVLGFAHINILISINDKEIFDLGVLGRGPRRANRYLRQFYSKIQDQIAI